MSEKTGNVAPATQVDRNEEVLSRRWLLYRCERIRESDRPGGRNRAPQPVPEGCGRWNVYATKQKGPVQASPCPGCGLRHRLNANTRHFDVFTSKEAAREAQEARQPPEAPTPPPKRLVSPTPHHNPAFSEEVLRAIGHVWDEPQEWF